MCVSSRDSFSTPEITDAFKSRSVYAQTLPQPPEGRVEGFTASPSQLLLSLEFALSHRMRLQHTLAVAPHLLISRVCTPYLLSIRYFPGSPAWQIRLPSLYLVGGNIHVSVIADIFLQFYPNLWDKPFVL